LPRQPCLECRGMEVIIFGCGRLTSMVVHYLVQFGYRVTVLDADAACLESLIKEDQAKAILISDPMMQDYLQEGGIGITEVFLALSENDYKNALVAQIARHIFNVHTVICLLENPQLQQLYSGLGLKVIGPSILTLFQDIRQAVEG
jgi:Trk K+ transport system NAD-binding subunit